MPPFFTGAAYFAAFFDGGVAAAPLPAAAAAACPAFEPFFMTMLLRTLVLGNAGECEVCCCARWPAPAAQKLEKAGLMIECQVHA